MGSRDLAEFKIRLLAPLTPVGGRYRLEYLWHFDLALTPEQVWLLVSDTSRMNRDLGLPAWKEETIDGLLHVETVMLGRSQSWIEQPWVWVESREIQNRRLYRHGWLTEQKGVYRIDPRPDGCRVSVYFEWGFDSLLARGIFWGVAPLLRRRFAEFFRNKENRISPAGPASGASPVRVERQHVSGRLAELRRELTVRKAWSPSQERLLQYLLTEDEMDLDKIRLKKVAATLDLPLGRIMEPAQALVENGYLYLTWDVICPHCRSAVASERRLSDIGEKNSCEACEVEFSLDGEESVEVVFHSTKKLREVNVQQYCAAEPAKKKHIKFFQILNPGESRTFLLHLAPGIYRVRDRNRRMMLSVGDETGAGSFEWPPAAETDEPAKVLADFALHVRNTSDHSLPLTLEETWWLKDRLLPGEILSYPEFRNLFSTDHLGAGVKLYLGHQVLLFTDIVGSTPLYRELGDARAFEAVRRHYETITGIIGSTHGVLIKFIGDAVMAAYLDLDDALTAAFAMQRAFSAQRTEDPIRLRVSLNYGPVLCANLNVGLDYFGSTVNTAAKIQKWGGAHQIILPREIWETRKELHAARVLRREDQHDEKLGVDVVILSVE